MKYNLEQAIKGYDNKKITEEDGQDWTYSNALKFILNQSKQEDKPEMKKKIFDITMKLYNGNVVELSSEEVTLIKERVGEFGHPILVGRVEELLEQKEKS